MIWLYGSANRLLIDAPANRHVWRRAWLLSGLTALAGVASLGVVAALSAQSWVRVFSFGWLAIAPLTVGVGFAVMATRHAGLWFLYLCAPPVALTAVLSAIGLVSPVALLLSWFVGVPLLLGVLLSSACAVWVSDKAEAITRGRSQRSTGPSSDLPVLRWQNGVRMVRLTAAAICAFLAVASPALLRPIGLGAAFGVAFLVGGVACLRFEATLLCWAGQPLVAVEGQSARATYAGRWALLASPASILSLINEPCAARASVAVMALLCEGSLGPAVRRASSRLALDQAHRLTLSLSLRPGGAGAIRYLSTALPGQIRPTALTYARLADEAASPPDLQRWLAALTDHSGVGALADTGLAPELALMLADARDTLLRYSSSPATKSGVDGLRQIIVALCGTIDPSPTGGSQTNWPGVLMARVAAHGRLLGAHRIAGSHVAHSE